VPPLQMDLDCRWGVVVLVGAGYIRPAHQNRTALAVDGVPLEHGTPWTPRHESCGSGGPDAGGAGSHAHRWFGRWSDVVAGLRPASSSSFNGRSARGMPARGASCRTQTAMASCRLASAQSEGYNGFTGGARSASGYGERHDPQVHCGD
jgi:hypothetical protein